MAAAKTLSEKRRDAVNVRYERERLIKSIAAELFGEPLDAKTTDELRNILAGAAVRR